VWKFCSRQPVDVLKQRSSGPSAMDGAQPKKICSRDEPWYQVGSGMRSTRQAASPMRAWENFLEDKVGDWVTRGKGCSGRWREGCLSSRLAESTLCAFDSCPPLLDERQRGSMYSAQRSGAHSVGRKRAPPLESCSSEPQRSEWTHQAR
jgi:hypothetical protein